MKYNEVEEIYGIEKIIEVALKNSNFNDEQIQDIVERFQSTIEDSLCQALNIELEYIAMKY